jgi:hypothetical protein
MQVHGIPLEQPLLDGRHQTRVAHKLLQAAAVSREMK